MVAIAPVICIEPDRINVTAVGSSLHISDFYAMGLTSTLSSELCPVASLTLLMRICTMNALKRLEAVLKYFGEALVRIFGPNDKNAPEVGIQPFGGEPLSDWVDED
jgi:hypothetical protein